MDNGISYANKLIDKFIKDMDKMTETQQTQESQPVSTDLKWATPEDYKKETGKRFRLTKEELASGQTRQEVFEARQRAGKL